MPFFTLSVSPGGPLVDAIVMPSEAKRQALVAANQPIPQAQVIRGLIDTGASGTCIDPSVLKALGLTPTGKTLCNTPTTGAQPVEKDLYDIGLVIPGPKGTTPLIRPTVAVMESELLQAQGFHALIGRDILAGCVLTYNGAGGFFIVAY